MASCGLVGGGGWAIVINAADAAVGGASGQCSHFQKSPLNSLQIPTGLQNPFKSSRNSFLFSDRRLRLFLLLTPHSSSNSYPYHIISPSLSSAASTENSILKQPLPSPHNPHPPFWGVPAPAPTPLHLFFLSRSADQWRVFVQSQWWEAQFPLITVCSGLVGIRSNVFSLVLC